MSGSKETNGLREVLRRYPTGVTVVTSILDGKPWGGTMNSFTSVSLDPPLVALFVMENSRTTAAIRQTGKYVINILKHDQGDLATRFASDGIPDKFEGVQHVANSNGIPLLGNCLGYIECTLESSQKISDHILFIGETKKASVALHEEALIYYRRAFRSFSQP